MSQAEDPRTLRKERGGEVAVEDVRRLMGASTPHFALQLRERIARLIAGLPRITRPASKARARSRGWSAWASRARCAASRGRPASVRCPRSTAAPPDASSAGPRRPARGGHPRSGRGAVSAAPRTAARRAERHEHPRNRRGSERVQRERHGAVEQRRRHRRQQSGVRAVAAEVLADRRVERPQHDDADADEQERSARFAARGADRDGDQADQDRELGERKRMPGGARALANRPRRAVAAVASRRVRRPATLARPSRAWPSPASPPRRTTSSRPGRGGPVRARRGLPNVRARVGHGRGRLRTSTRSALARATATPLAAIPRGCRRQLGADRRSNAAH